MNKQRLASKIWESANKMRSKIEANDFTEDDLHQRKLELLRNIKKSALGKMFI